MLASGLAGGFGATIAMLARGSCARMRPCPAICDTHTTGGAVEQAVGEENANGSPSLVRLARVPTFVVAATVRASSAAHGRAGLVTCDSGGGTVGASLGFSMLATLIKWPPVRAFSSDVGNLADGDVEVDRRAGPRRFGPRPCRTP